MPLPVEHAVEKIDERVQGTMLMKGRTAALHRRRGGSGDTLFQHRDQTRFPNTPLADEHHHLAHAGFGVLPTFQEQLDFAFPADQWCQGIWQNCVQPVLRLRDFQDAIDGHGPRHTASHPRPQRLACDRALEQLIGGLADHHGIRNGHLLQPRGNMGCFPQR
jgi:hypothetical protein